VVVDIQGTTDIYVTGTGEGGCESRAELRIAINSPLEVTASVRNTCAGSSAGGIDLTVKGGTAPYRYSWSNRATTEDLSGLGSGTYSVRIDDAYGCSVSRTFSVSSSNTLPTLGVTVPEGICEGSTATVVLTPSEAMRVTYQIGGGALQSVNTEKTPLQIQIGAGAQNPDFLIRSAVSTATGCAIAEGSILRTIPVVRVPGLEVDNVSVCSGEVLRLPVRQSAPSGNLVRWDWKADYAGATGGAGSGTGSVPGALTERLSNGTSSVIAVVYTLTPYVVQGGLRCEGLPRQVRVQVEPQASLEAVAEVEVCGNTPFTVPLRALNAANPLISWSRSIGGAEVRAGILWICCPLPRG
jgi:hypothetical protein